MTRSVDDFKYPDHMRVIAHANRGGGIPSYTLKFYPTNLYSRSAGEEYRRADLPPTPAQIAADPGVVALVEAAMQALIEAVADDADPWFANLRAALAAFKDAKP